MAIEYSNNFHTFLWNEFIIDFITGFYRECDKNL